jgi:hypothetical protein
LAGKFVADLVGQFQKLKTNVTHWWILIFTNLKIQKQTQRSQAE